ncbi:thioesterase [Micromonospora orduensis]|uniref:Thioesterase n=1 Tax=Micromonospora orduensis TaxID=1420891 RepID=A0A5C4QFY1_9ACTN|nr:thioesterase domain-containing protein [Micromonospora orduensis]TNH22698.1 thioesterase [Micromonospora orduensis]
MSAGSTSRWLLRRPVPESRGRIFCFPYSGIGASMFNKWPRSIDGVEVCPIQFPARENRIREPHYETYERLVEELVEALPPYLDRPFIFFGHCAGALPAFETARLLADLGLPTPVQVVVSAQVGPQHCPRDRWLDLNETELRAELAALTRRRGGEPHPLHLDLTMDVLRRDLDANRVYHRAEAVTIPSGIVVLHWSDDVEVRAAELTGWADYATDVSFTTLPGGHYEFLSGPTALLDLLVGAFGAVAAAERRG